MFFVNNVVKAIRYYICSFYSSDLGLSIFGELFFMGFGLQKVMAWTGDNFAKIFSYFTYIDRNQNMRIAGSY